MIKLKLTILFIILIIVSGCSEFALLMSGSSIAISQNAYVKAYNGMDVLTIMHSDKSIKKHAYEKGKKYIYDQTIKPDLKNSNNISYKFFYWGPLLFKAKLQPKDLKACAKLCSKKSSFVNETLAGIIKHEHYVNHSQLVKILDPYLSVFRQCFKHWYGRSLDRKIIATTAWVNFMGAGEFNPPHTHMNCDFSSVFFIKIPEKLKEENKKFVGTGAGPGSITFNYGEPQEYAVPTISSSFPKKETFLYFQQLSRIMFVLSCLKKKEYPSVQILSYNNV